MKTVFTRSKACL